MLVWRTVAAMSDQGTADGPSDEQVAARSNLLPEEKQVGSEDPHGQAEAILEESEARTLERNVATGGQVVEHRTSDDVVEPVDPPSPS